ncbi:uncharacterized protein LOC110445957 isoform X1 [Mizuhopecten yessoensis]|uniref:Uncharacterized protein n=1 Tax=Mizuhopecten yessoensis TaxID=6573 RepID=A0A210QYP0_MIZYE|nr:uncharacterized protein LOC110445957 isoform X1 [Mizuhopecten yessoensis]OWF53781.1 hypothetical protein KP79_PYT08450 [Mizuhopecten yessoensis]
MARTTYILQAVLCVFLSLSRDVEMSELVSLNGQTVESSSYHLPKYAVDGDLNSCAYQARRQVEVYLRVNLQRRVNIEKVEIHYREELSVVSDLFGNRFSGFEVYLSNSTQRRREDQCSKDQSANVNQFQSFVSLKECKGTAQYVIIYNHRETLGLLDLLDDNALPKLCEVKVYGCDEGTYGNGNCDETCSSNCPGSLCYPNSGICLYRGDTTNTTPGTTACRPCPGSCAGPCDDSGCCKDHGDTTNTTPGTTACRPCPGSCTGPCDDSGCCKDEQDTARMTKEPITTPVLAGVTGLLAILLMVSVIIIIKMRIKQTTPSRDENHQEDTYDDLNTMALQPPNTYDDLRNVSNSQGRK